MNNNDVMVQFVDYGNSKKLSLENVLTINPKFLELPKQCAPCALQGIPVSQWSEKELGDFETVMEESQLVVFTGQSPNSGQFHVQMFGPFRNSGATTVLNINHVLGMQSGKLSADYVALDPATGASRTLTPSPGSVAMRRLADGRSPDSTRETSSSGFSGSVRGVNEDSSSMETQAPNWQNSQAAESNRAPGRTSGTNSMPASCTRTSSHESEDCFESNAYLDTTELVSGDTIYVSFSESPMKFWCQPVVSSDLFTNLVEELNEEYSGLSPAALLVNSPQVGQMCCAKYAEDESWYRARVMSVEGENIEVYFVDYGNQEITEPKNLKYLKPQYARLPCQAVECSLVGIRPLHGVAWTEEAHNKFKELYEDKELQVRRIVTQRGAILSVEVGETGKRTDDLAQQLVLAGVAAPLPSSSTKAQIPGRTQPSGLGRSVSLDSSSSEGFVSPRATPQFKRVLLQSGSSTVVTVSHVENPAHFYCHVTESTRKLKALMEKIDQDFTDCDARKIARATVGQVCCARYQADGRWYRAEVTACNGNDVQVPQSGSSVVLCLQAARFCVQMN